MAAEALTKMGDKLGLPTKVETNGSDGAKNVLTPEEIAACDGIIIAADKNVETARFDGKPVLFARVDDGIHKPEELIKKIAHGETPIYHAEAGAKTRQAAGGPFGWCLPKNAQTPSARGSACGLPIIVHPSVRPCGNRPSAIHKCFNLSPLKNLPDELSKLCRMCYNVKKTQKEATHAGRVFPGCRDKI